MCVVFHSVNSLPLLFLGNKHQPKLFFCKILRLQNPSWWNLLLLLFFNMLWPLRAILIICQEAHYTLITSICCSGRLKINLFWLFFSRLRVEIPPLSPNLGSWAEFPVPPWMQHWHEHKPELPAYFLDFCTIYHFFFWIYTQNWIIFYSLNYSLPVFVSKLKYKSNVLSFSISKKYPSKIGNRDADMILRPSFHIVIQMCQLKLKDK